MHRAANVGRVLNPSAAAQRPPSAADGLRTRPTLPGSVYCRPMIHAYGIPTDHELLTIAHQVAESVLAPNAASVDHDARFPAESIEALGENGLLGLCVDVAHGGRGASPR